MKDIKSVFEKMGLLEKVETHAETDNVVLSPETSEASEAGKITTNEVSDSKENKIGSRESDEPAGEINIRKLLKADEIYNNFNIKSQGTNSLFIIESYLKALPDFLPMDVKRESVLNIISSSGMNIESLLSDGRDKLKCLKGFSQSFSYEVKDAVSKYEDEIKKLSGTINRYNKIIHDIKSLEEEQTAVIDYEVEKINNITQFMTAAK